MVNQIANGQLGDPFYGANLTRWLQGLAIAHKVHVENLDAELKASGLEYPMKLPKANASHRVAWPDYFKQPGLLETIKPWAEPDFELSGYEWPH
jgi:hypothetical protein